MTRAAQKVPASGEQTKACALTQAAHATTGPSKHQRRMHRKHVAHETAVRCMTLLICRHS